MAPELIDPEAVAAALGDLAEQSAAIQQSIDDALAMAQIEQADYELALARLERNYPYGVRDIAANFGARGLSNSGLLMQSLRRNAEDHDDRITDLSLGLQRNLLGLSSQAATGTAALQAQQRAWEEILGLLQE